MRSNDRNKYRLDRFSALLAERFRGNKAALGRAMGYGSGAYIRQLLAGERTITEAVIDAVHAIPGCEGWFAADSWFTLENTVRNNSNNAATSAPVIAWASVGELLMKTNKEVEGCPSQPAPPGASERFKWVIAAEDMPAFGVQAGHHMAIDPVDGSFQPAERKIYLFRTEAGHHFIGRYRGLSGGNFEAVTAVGDVYTKAQHGVAILGRFRGAIEP